MNRNWLCVIVLLALVIGLYPASAPGETSHPLKVVMVSNSVVLLSSGQICILEPYEGWVITEVAIPVPVSEVAFLLYIDSFIDINNNGWCLEDTTWVNYGAPGDSSAVTSPGAWGSIKAYYR